MKSRIRDHLRERGIWYIIVYVAWLVVLGPAMVRETGSLTGAVLPLVVLALSGVVGGAFVFAMWMLVLTLQARGERRRVQRK